LCDQKIIDIPKLRRLGALVVELIGANFAIEK